MDVMETDTTKGNPRWQTCVPRKMVCEERQLSSHGLDSCAKSEGSGNGKCVRGVV